MIHDFRESLARSHEAEDWPGWAAVYREAFPSMVGMYSHRQDGEHQRAGIDRSITLSNSKQLLVDEKVRGLGPHGEIWRDIALEIWSDEAAQKPGWVVKAIRADYIAYLNRPAGWCYLLPVLQLQSAWVRLGDFWCEEYGPSKDGRKKGVRAQNRGWVTVSCPVPIAPLFAAIGSCLRIRCPAETFDNEVTV